MLAAILVYLLVDTKVVLVSASVSHLSFSIFAMAQMLYPIHQDLFLFPVQLIGPNDLKLFEGKGPCLLGLHATGMDCLSGLNGGQYVFVNADVPYLTAVGVEALPEGVIRLAAEFHDLLLDIVKLQKPGFPAACILSALRKLILDVYKQVIGIRPDHMTLCEYLKTVSVLPQPHSEPFAIALSTSVITTGFGQLLNEEGPRSLLLKVAMWPADFDPQYRGVIKWPPRSRVLSPEAPGPVARSRFSVLPVNRRSVSVVQRSKSFRSPDH
jgi:hypothetical protein